MRAIINFSDIKKSPQPFEEYLKEIHSHDYTGTDDDMSDDFENFITNLDCEELIEHSNAFSKMLIDLMK